MQTNTDKVISQETKPTLQLKRPLLPIDEYAAREGLSIKFVEECAKLGIIQIRRYKGKTFVVDVPLNLCHCASEAVTSPAQHIDEAAHARKISELAQKVAPEYLETTTEPAKPEESIKAGTIAQLANKMFCKASQITGRPTEDIDDEINQAEHIPEPSEAARPEPLETNDEPATPADDVAQTKDLFEPIQTPELQTSKIADEPTDFIDGEPKMLAAMPAVSACLAEDSRPASALGGIDEIVETEQKPQSAQTTQKPPSARTTQKDESQPGTLTAQTGYKRTRQIAVIFSTVCLFAALWLYMDRKIQLNRIDQEQTHTQKVYDDLTQANLQIKALDSQLSSSKTQTERIKNEMDNAMAHADTVQDDLAQARQNLEAIRQRNSEVAVQLNERIQRLATRLTKLAKNPQTSPETSIWDR